MSRLLLMRRQLAAGLRPIGYMSLSIFLALRIGKRRGYPRLGPDRPPECEHRRRRSTSTAAARDRHRPSVPADQGSSPLCNVTCRWPSRVFLTPSASRWDLTALSKREFRPDLTYSMRSQVRGNGGRVDIEVRDRDIEGISIEAAPGLTVSGRIVPPTPGVLVMLRLDPSSDQQQATQAQRRVMALSRSYWLRITGLFSAEIIGSPCPDSYASRRPKRPCPTNSSGSAKRLR